jgi:S-methylmethionine-dependent homocysteine/selenocysteine methylase
MYVTDGGIETHLIFNLAQDLPNFSAYVLARSDVLRDYYRSYLEIAKAAGRPFVFDTATWRASPDWAELNGHSMDQLRQANIDAVHLCRDLREEFAVEGVRSVVSGVIGPRRDGWKYDAAMTAEESEAYHAVQVDAFVEAGVDYVTVYTLTNTPEAIGIARACMSRRLPVVLSFTLETDGNLPGGKPLGQAIGEVDAATDRYASYFMLNCVHPVHFATTIRNAGTWIERIGGLRANASSKSHAELDASPTLDIGDMRDLAQWYDKLLPLMPNLRVVGGCCGTDHRHIGEICTHALPHAEQHGGYGDGPHV